MIEEIQGSERLLALVFSTNIKEVGNHFATDTNNPLQIGMIVRNSGDIIPAHNHLNFQSKYEGPRQEFLYIAEGKVRIEIFDTSGEKVTERTLKPGDALLQLAGGHGFYFEEPTRLVEVKQGPYLGKEKDKNIYG